MMRSWPYEPLAIINRLHAGAVWDGNWRANSNTKRSACMWRSDAEMAVTSTNGVHHVRSPWTGIIRHWVCAGLVPLTRNISAIRDHFSP